MFASLKSKIKEETGSDIGKLTSNWRSGAFLGRITLKDDSSTSSPSISAEHGDTTSDSISPQMESYLSDRTGGQVDQTALQQQYSEQLEAKLQERDAYWEQKIEELKLSVTSAQGEEALAAQAVARAAQAEAVKATGAREQAEKQLNELRVRLSAAEHAQDKLDTLTEELEQAHRSWSRERAAAGAALAAAEGAARDRAHEVALLRARLPPDRPQLQDKAEGASECEECSRAGRERGVLTRQLQETKMALADVKTSWSGQIASLETQVARLSRQAGEEGAERRRAEMEKRELQEEMAKMAAELEKTKQTLANSEAKVSRLSGEVRTLAAEARSLRQDAEKSMDLESRVETLSREKAELWSALESEREAAAALRAEAGRRRAELQLLHHDCDHLHRTLDKVTREKDEALLRNAQMSQSLEMRQCNVRYLETEVADHKAKIAELEALIAQHKENQAECMLIKQHEASRLAEIEQLKKRIEEMTESGVALRNNIQDLETEICDKNKKIKTLDNRIADMKKTLQKELQSSKSDLTSAEEQDISRRYLKHVVLRFLTARELEARQLTRALAVLLRLTAHEEALLRAAHARSGLAAWFPNRTTS